MLNLARIVAVGLLLGRRHQVGGGFGRARQSRQVAGKPEKVTKGAATVVPTPGAGSAIGGRNTQVESSSRGLNFGSQLFAFLVWGRPGASCPWWHSTASVALVPVRHGPAPRYAAGHAPAADQWGDRMGVHGRLHGGPGEPVPPSFIWSGQPHRRDADRLRQPARYLTTGLVAGFLGLQLLKLVADGMKKSAESAAGGGARPPAVAGGKPLTGLPRRLTNTLKANLETWPTARTRNFREN